MQRAQLCVTFRYFPRLWLVLLRDFLKSIAIIIKSRFISIMPFLIVLRPSATFRDFSRFWFVTLAATVQRSG
jgi:hypothetical protein